MPYKQRLRDWWFVSQPDLCVKPEAWGQLQARPCGYCLSPASAPLLVLHTPVWKGGCAIQIEFSASYSYDYLRCTCVWKQISRSIYKTHRTIACQECTPVSACACLSSSISINYTSACLHSIYCFWVCIRGELFQHTWPCLWKALDVNKICLSFEEPPPPQY